MLSVYNYSNLSGDIIQTIFDNYKNSLIELNNKIADLVNCYDLSYNNVIQPMIDLENHFAAQSTVFEMDSFHPDENIRTKVNNISKKLCDLYVDQSMRKDVYQTFIKYYNTQFNDEKNYLHPHQVKYVENIKLNYLINGLELDDDKYNLFKEYKSQMLKNSNDFSFNIAEDKTTYKFHQSKFNSMPKYWLDAKQPDENGEITVSLKYPDYVPIMEYCEDREIRKIIMHGYLNRGTVNNNGKNNVALLHENLSLRAKLASLFDMSYVDYKLQDKMAKKSTTLYDFLTLVQKKVKPHLQSDLQKLNQFAELFVEPHDSIYYSRLYKERELSLNMEELKKLFKTHDVIDGTMQIYQTLLNLTFKNVSEQYQNTFWHESVQLFQVTDNLTNSPIGYFYLDLYPRPGKYSHAAVFPFVKRSDKHLPTATMACNFDSSGTLSFDEVETFFHEFGHVMHNMCTTSTIPSLSGTSVERDFVETPSQFFENWCYDYDSLKLLAPNITHDYVDKLNCMKTMLNGIHYSKQLVYALIDVKLHDTNDEQNANDVYKKLYTEILSYAPPENTNTLASFTHIMGGYDAGYYGYMWSEVYAKLLHNKFKNHMLDPTYGLRLRNCILAPGGTQDSNISMEQFLGKPLDFETDVNVFINSLFGDNVVDIITSVDDIHINVSTNTSLTMDT